MRESVATFRNGQVIKLSFVGLAYLDLILTLYAFQAGFSEMNPLMASMLSNPMQLVAFKVVAPPLIAWLVPDKLLLPSIFAFLCIVVWNVNSLMAG